MASEKFPVSFSLVGGGGKGLMGTTYSILISLIQNSFLNLSVFLLACGKHKNPRPRLRLSWL